MTICRSREANLKNSRSLSLAAALVLLPETPRAAVWGGRGTVARPRAIAWYSGAAGVEKAILK